LEEPSKVRAGLATGAQFFHLLLCRRSRSFGWSRFGGRGLRSSHSEQHWRGVVQSIAPDAEDMPAGVVCPLGVDALLLKQLDEARACA